VSPAAGFVVAGTHSGVGKTSLALGLMGALKRRGHAVAPFKVGPDYIDPTYHTSICGRPSRNLDTWLMPADEAVGVFSRAVAAVAREADVPSAAAGAAGPLSEGRLSQSVASAPPGPALSDPDGSSRTPLAVVEGVMGVFDGLAGGGDRCSTAEMAKLLRLPVVLVIDCSHMARSAAAIVHGFSTFDADLRVAGIILNKVASPDHGRMILESLGPAAPPVVGVVPRRADLHLESRHLGLIPTVEGRGVDAVLAEIVAHVEQNVDLDAVVSVAAPVDVEQTTGAPVVGHSADHPHPLRRVAVARDEAFSFYYEDNLDVLREEGAALHFFSPVAGHPLPDCDALYLGGGYPEVYAAELAANTRLAGDLREAVASGLPIYAECGGYLYLGREIEDARGVHQMSAVLPTRASMTGARLRMGYVGALASSHHPLAGADFQGHLFHYSATTGSEAPAYHVSRRGLTVADGWADGHVVASYVHLHFRGSRRVATWLAGGEKHEETPDHA
jgi:cobyrinic acid a,c-diamide synthase